MASLSQFGYMHSSLVYSGWLTDWLAPLPFSIFAKRLFCLFVVLSMLSGSACPTTSGRQITQWTDIGVADVVRWDDIGQRFAQRIFKCSFPLTQYELPLVTAQGAFGSHFQVQHPRRPSVSNPVGEKWEGGVEWAGSLSVWRWFWFCCNRLAHFLSSLAPLIMADHLFWFGFRISQLFALIKHKHRRTHTLSWTDENSSKQK